MADLDGPYDVPCGDGDDAAAADNTDQEAATTDADLILPPLPPPLKTRNLEFCCGATTILTCVAVAAGVAVAVIFAPSSNLSPTAKIVCAVLVGVECLVALISLLVIGFGAPRCAGIKRRSRWNLSIYAGDPGIVKRTPATTNPIPKEVAERLRAGEGLDGLQNFVDESRGVYCVKCCVWWPRNAVHCTTCRRCCRDHDHHCGFYGRCIAKKNITYFFAVGPAGWAAIVTCIIFAALALAPPIR